MSKVLVPSEDRIMLEGNCGQFVAVVFLFHTNCNVDGGKPATIRCGNNVGY